VLSHPVISLDFPAERLPPGCDSEARNAVYRDGQFAETHETHGQVVRPPWYNLFCRFNLACIIKKARESRLYDGLATPENGKVPPPDSMRRST
jgi:hypothetical protein